jgi:hypothetical protein
MFTEDYIIRILSQAIAALQEALGLRKRGKYGEGLQVIQVAQEGLFGIPSELLEQMDFNSLLEILSQDGELDLNRAMVAADLFEEAGNLYEALGLSGKALASRMHALDVYLQVAFLQPDADDPRLSEKIAVLDAQLAGKQALETINLLFYYYERTGNIHGSLQALDQLLDLSNHDISVVSEAIEFYQRLLKMEAKDIKAAGLQPGEIEARLKSLRGD